MNRNRMISISLALCLFRLMIGSACLAAQTGDQVIFNFGGTFVVSTPCTISNDEVINIAFGNVGVDRVDGSHYAQPIPYNVDCHGAPDSSPLELTVTGTAESYDDTALVTSADGLGIQIQANGVPMKLNQALSTTLGSIPSLTLTAVPVKDPAKTLKEQPFTATATLTADYQ
ncbi:fimbrial protein [Enterobacter sichuanensis]|uniref:fimbrial protein n=1 Tax=Enterobacter sichuanensis TaxID=2071710 RepID=UPI00217E5931|nr:fimbrial protein [Enterobacter sichuanensis]WKW90267.1 putative fimbrial-like protein YfcQ [Enterobacter sichuanensis]